MNKSIILRCFLVSLGVSVLAAILTTTILVAPAEGEFVFDLGTIDPEILNQGNQIEASEHLASLPMREISGIERFTYPFSHPQYFLGLLNSIFTWFVGVLIATLLVSYINAKHT